MNNELINNNLKDLQLGQTQAVIVLVKSVNTMRAKSGMCYQWIAVRDQFQNETQCIIWDNFIHIDKVKIPSVMKLTLNIGEYNGSLSYKVLAWEVDTQANKDLFKAKANFNQVEAWGKIVDYVKGVRAPLRQIAARVLNDCREDFIQLPMSNGYKETGGILESTLKLTEAASKMADIYSLDKDLMIAGAALYYIGRTETVDEMGSTLPDDLLIGDGSLAFEKIVEAKIKTLETCKGKENKKDLEELIRTSQDVRLLEHVVLSRHTGIKTAIPEAVCLRLLSMATLEIKEAQDTIRDAADGAITSNPALHSGRVYKPAK